MNADLRDRGRFSVSLSPMGKRYKYEITEVSSNGDRVGFCYDIIVNHRDGS